jgi:hypothetical protein
MSGIAQMRAPVHKSDASTGVLRTQTMSAMHKFAEPLRSKARALLAHAQ